MYYSPLISIHQFHKLISDISVIRLVEIKTNYNDMKQVLLAIIRLYQLTLSLDHGLIGKIIPIRACRFTPSCSQYSYEAIKKYGSIKGSAKGIKRIIRCNPWSKGGWDPVK